MGPIRVFLADDHGIVRTGLRTLLASLGGFNVIGEAANGRDALNLIERDPPDVLLTDISMPGLNGYELTTLVIKSFPQVRVIALSVHTPSEYVSQALKAGATGYLLKDATAAELLTAIESVLCGSVYLTPAVTSQVLDEYVRTLRGETSEPHGLTRRQREILQLIAEGHSLKDISHILDISVKTVESHRTQLMQRLGIFDTASLVRYALRVGMIALEP